ncbi:hypothetical protein D9615_007539 [Tricholomella constricta]|uniref:CCHC-type domain-containing protein n=1 Tax=Tricholomella constricta TaxID=117010 RepID=A0A8H5H7K2_9AGAR|nr:hypothetical protein D9615_007539 [Tricholomella constricta]
MLSTLNIKNFTAVPFPSPPRSEDSQMSTPGRRKEPRKGSLLRIESSKYSRPTATTRSRSSPLITQQPPSVVLSASTSSRENPTQHNQQPQPDVLAGVSQAAETVPASNPWSFDSAGLPFDEDLFGLNLEATEQLPEPPQRPLDNADAEYWYALSNVGAIFRLDKYMFVFQNWDATSRMLEIPRRSHWILSNLCKFPHIVTSISHDRQFNSATMTEPFHPQAQGHAQPAQSTSLGSHPSNRRTLSVPNVLPSGPWLDPVVPQSFAVTSAPVSPYYNVLNSWSQSHFPSQSPSHPISVPLLQPPPTFTGYAGPGLFPSQIPLHTSSNLRLRPPTAPLSSMGLSYASSNHLPIIQTPAPTPVAPSSTAHGTSLPSHTLTSPFSVEHPPRHLSPHNPVAPIPLRPIPFVNRVVSPSFHTPLAPAPPYFQHQFNPVPNFPQRIHSASPTLTHNSLLRSLTPSASSLHLPRPASMHRLSPLSPFLHQLPLPAPTPPPLPLDPPALPLAHATLPTPFRTISTYTKPDFPNLSSIPLLSSANDWSKWHSAVLQVIEATGLYDHIVDVLPHNVLLDPTAYPSLPPVIDRANYTPEQLEHYKTWWAQDDIVSFVLVGKLGSTPQSLIPPKRDAWGNPQRTARDVLHILRTKYGVYDANSAAIVRESVLSKKVIGSDVSSYVDLWRKAVLQVEGSHWDFSSYEKVQRFADGLPRTYEYEALRVLIREGFNSHPPHGVITFHDASQAALNIEQASRRLSASHGSTPRRSQAPPSVPTSNPTQNSSTNPPADPTNPSTSNTATRPRCSNCGALGHVAGNCWEPGGGDVGGRDRYLAANPPRPRAHIATASDTLLEPVVETVESEIESAPEPIASYPSSDAPPVNLSDSALYSDFTQVTSPIVLASLADRFNAILDSGCTVHIIRDRRFFWTYDTSLAVPVGTANCGTLQTLARGEVRFRIVLDGIEQIISLPDCLHAPDVPINLLSVGSMTEKNVRLVFEKDATSIQFPDASPSPTSHTIEATVVRRLSFLHLDFVLPPSSPVPRLTEDLIAFPAVEQRDSDLRFHRVDLTPNLWHRRFGHLGTFPRHSLYPLPHWQTSSTAF